MTKVCICQQYANEGWVDFFCRRGGILAKGHDGVKIETRRRTFSSAPPPALNNNNNCDFKKNNEVKNEETQNGDLHIRQRP